MLCVLPSHAEFDFAVQSFPNLVIFRKSLRSQFAQIGPENGHVTIPDFDPGQLARPDGIKERLENLTLPDEIPSIKNSRIDHGRNAALYVSRGFGFFPFDRSSSNFAVAAVKPKSNHA